MNDSASEGDRHARDARVASGDDMLVPSLEVIGGTAASKVVRLSGAKLTIGRSPNSDLVLKDDAVSRAHAEIVFEDGQWLVEDLHSVNGVAVNGEKVTRAALATGTRVTLGKTTLVFSMPEPTVAEERRVALLERCEGLAKLDRDSKRALAAAMVPRLVPRKALVVRQGAPVQSLLFVHAGSLRLVEVNDEGGEKTVGKLGPGDYFGERALLPGQQAPCSLVADSDACLVELAQARIVEVVQATPESSATVLLSVREKLSTGRFEAAREASRPDALAHPMGPGELVILGEDRRIQAARKKVEKLAKDGAPVVIVGEPGTGRRTFARYYHRSGARTSEPYLEVSLAELEPAALEAALFGVEGGQGSEHVRARIGYLETLGSGTLVLLGAECLDAHQQSKLLTYLKLGWFHRAYGQVAVKAETCVVFIAAGTQEDFVGRLIPELRERLKDAVVTLPPLAQRVKDIPVLADHFLKTHARAQGRKADAFTREAKEKLVSYGWPGNITELENIVQRAAIISREGTIIPADLIFVVPPEKEVHKLNLLRNEKLRAQLRRPLLLGLPTWANLAFVGMVTMYVLAGATRPLGHPLREASTNPGMLLTWLVWFPLLPLATALVGRVWCGACPIAAFGELVARLKRFNLPVPKIFKRLDFWMLIGAYLTVELLEGVFEVDANPAATAAFLFIILTAAAAFTVLFERRAFCRYLCPLAPWLGAYSTLSPLEIRGNKKVCQTQCGEHTCYKGTEKVPGCPMFLYPASMTSSHECLLCTNCVKSCDNRGVQLNLRPPVSELWRNAQPTVALSLFAVILAAVMLRHQLTHLAWWQGIQARWMVHPALQEGILLVGFIAVGLLAFGFSATLSAAASQEKVGVNMAQYGIAFLPLALSAHLAAMGSEVLGDGLTELLAFVGLGPGANPAAGAAVIPFLHPAVIAFIKVLLVVGGIAASLVALIMIARRVSKRPALPRILPHLLLLGAAAVVFLVVFASTPA